MRRLKFIALIFMSHFCLLGCTGEQKTETFNFNHSEVNAAQDSSAGFIRVIDSTNTIRPDFILDTLVRVDDQSFSFFWRVWPLAFQSGNIDLEIQALEALSRISFADAVILTRLGLAYERKGMRREAQVNYEKSILLADSLISHYHEQQDTTNEYVYASCLAGAYKFAFEEQHANDSIQKMIDRYANTFIVDELRKLKSLSRDSLIQSLKQENVEREFPGYE